MAPQARVARQLVVRLRPARFLAALAAASVGIPAVARARVEGPGLMVMVQRGQWEDRALPQHILAEAAAVTVAAVPQQAMDFPARPEDRAELLKMARPAG